MSISIFYCKHLLLALGAPTFFVLRHNDYTTKYSVLFLQSVIIIWSFYFKNLVF